MAQQAPARTKIPTESPQPARGRAARQAKSSRTAPGRLLASGTGRAATRGGGPVIGGVVCQDITAGHMQQIVNAPSTPGEAAGAGDDLGAGPRGA
jgi:hypothetical protein